MINLVERSLAMHGLPRETPVRLSCSRGPTDARLLAALRAVGLTAVASSVEPTAADWVSAGHLGGPAPAPSAGGATR